MRTLALCLVLFVSTVSAQYVALRHSSAGPSYSDDFSGSSLAAKWVEYDPQGDVSLSVGSGVLTVSVPSGTDHDLYTGTDHALRLRQTYTGTTDFTLEMKVTTSFNANIQFFGLIVGTDNGNLMRSCFIYANSDVNVGGATHASLVYAENFWENDGDQLQPYYLRVEKTGTNYVCKHSYNGSSWTTDGTISWTGTVNHIGMMFGTASGASSPAYTCTVDYFTYTAQ